MCVRAMVAEGLLGISRVSIDLLQRLLFPRFNYAADHSGIQHLVIYRIGNIGDTVVAVPALAQIRQAFPQARITLLTSAGHADLPGAADVLTVFPGLVDSIFSYQPAELKQPGGLRRLSEAVGQHGAVDLFIDLPVSMQTLRRNLQELFFARMLNSRFVIGFGQLFPPVLKHVWSKEFPHKIPQTNIWLCEQLCRSGLPESSQWPVATLPEIAPILEKAGLSNQTPLLLVNAGGKLAIKQWPVALFTATLQKLLKENPVLQIGLLGSAAERALNQALAEGCGSSQVTNLAGELTLSETFALMQEARAILSNDTGTMHMAGILNIPVITPMGGQFPAPLWHPPSANPVFTPHRHAVACAPCFRETCRYAEAHCLTGISSSSVTESVQTAIQ